MEGRLTLDTGPDPGHPGSAQQEGAGSGMEGRLTLDTGPDPGHRGSTQLGSGLGSGTEGRLQCPPRTPPTLFPSI